MVFSHNMLTRIIIIGVLFMTSSCSHTIDPKNLPNYVSLDPKNPPAPRVLKIKSKDLSFPLSTEDLHDIATLEAKYDQEENCAGLAAPQIGIAKRFFIFAVDNPELKKWRPDLTDLMPKSIWINPKYTPIGTEQHTDYEGCFSVKDVAGEVPRYKKIKYEAYTPEGKKISGTAEGFLARVIQHETDHTMGILFVDKAIPGTVMTVEEYRAKRKAAMEKD